MEHSSPRLMMRVLFLTMSGRLFLLDKDEVIYGLGQQQTGKVNQRNQKLFFVTRI